MLGKTKLALLSGMLENAEKSASAEEAAERKARALEVASTIWKQIGIGTKMAVGARSPSALADKLGALTFQVGRGNATAIKVTLDFSDTYVVELVKARKHAGKYSVEVVEKIEDVFCDMLSDTIYHAVCK